MLSIKDINSCTKFMESFLFENITMNRLIRKKELSRMKTNFLINCIPWISWI